MFFDRKNKSKKIILFDFRSSSVAASIISVNPEISVPKILFVRREHYYFSEAPKPDEFINRAHVALKKIIKEINSFKINDPDIDNKISEIHVLYGSPWYTPDFLDIHYGQDKDFVFKKDLLSKIVRNATKDIEEGVEGEIIEKNVASILINGYETNDPFDKKTKDVKISFYLSYISSETKNDIENIIKDNFHIDEVISHSHTSVLYSFLKNYFYTANDYILLDVSGEMTEISIVRHSFFKKHMTIPVGSHIFTRKLSEMYGFDLYTSWSHLNLFLDKKNEPRSRAKIEKVFEHIKDYYLELVKNSFQEEKIIDIPTKIFIISDEEVRNLIRNIFESVDGYAGTLKMSKKPDIISFNKETFANLCLYSPGVRADNIISIFSNFVKMYTNTN